MSTLSEAVKYYDSSSSKQERNYAFFLMQMDAALGTEEAELLFDQASKDGKFIDFKSNDKHIDGGEYIIVDTMPS